MDNSICVSIRYLDAPWIAADFAILHEAAVNVWLDIDFHLLATKRTGDNELVCHLRQSYCKDPSASGVLAPAKQRQQHKPDNSCGARQRQREPGNDDHLVAHTRPPRRNTCISF
jgi:hypothetical protein